MVSFCDIFKKSLCFISIIAFVINMISARIRNRGILG